MDDQGVLCFGALDYNYNILIHIKYNDHNTKYQVITKDVGQFYLSQFNLFKFDHILFLTLHSVIQYLFWAPVHLSWAISTDSAMVSSKSESAKKQTHYQVHNRLSIIFSEIRQRTFLRWRDQFVS